MSQRRGGIVVPLFSLRSSRSWGVGEFADLPAFGAWLRAARQSFVQILPITEMPVSETSPYSALTAMAIDPIYISLPALPDFEALGGESAFSAADRSALASVRAAHRVDYREVRALKEKWLRRASRHFFEHELPAGTARARAFRDFTAAHGEWLEDYALFQALRARHELRPWWEWPEPLARRDAAGLRKAAEQLTTEIEYRKYAQWVAEVQWLSARGEVTPLQIFGDVPFMISADSPDVWTRQTEFRFDATVGVPPDAFSETGQDWGLPPWRWDVMKENGFSWMRTRAKRTAQLFDGFRLDHLVGLYRTYLRPLDKSVAPFFAPPDEATQVRLGETLVSLYTGTGAEVIAEDLGVVPEFVRASLERLRVPGYKVMRWERVWSEKGHPYADPSQYPATSIATTGTHDTESLVTWWDRLEQAEREEVLLLPSVKRKLADTTSALDAVVRGLLDAESHLAILPLQDLFGWSDRINTPAVVQEENWSWVVPWPVDTLLEIPEARERAAALAHWTQDARRALSN